MESQQQNQDDKQKKYYDIDVIQVSNIALAIKNKQHTINIELSVRCQNLPLMKAFGSTDSMIVIYKLTDQGDTGEQQWVQIGRTEIIYAEINPKFIKSFVFSFNEQKKQEIQFRVYDISHPKIQDLNEQLLIGKASTKLDYLFENQNTQLQILNANKKKGRSMLKINCVQYDGGNSKYQIGLQMNNTGITSKTDVFYVIQVLKLNEWIPIAKSQVVQIKKNPKFKEMEISYSKFPSQDNSRIKIKVYQVTKGKSKEYQQIGSTDQITIINILTSDDKAQIQRLYKSGIVNGGIKINKWRKVVRDSFISYIVNGAHLHLILGIDYSNSNNSNGVSLHHIQNGTNPYIQAIRQIIGVLQYFDYYNQIALYGFGAKLPPFYKSVGQCFALNGNFFNPTVIGGVQQIIKYYIENLQKNQLHGPTKIAQMIDLALQYAQSQQNASSNYYVLILMTDGQIDDFNDTVDRIVKASTLPLSIVIVGIGDKDFGLIKALDSDTELLKNSKGERCQRDIVDFIKLDNFTIQNGDITLARQTFAQIPKQFIDYMNSKNIKPSRQKKSLKAAKQEFISQKIKQTKNLSNDKSPIVIIPQFLQYKKKKMKKDLVSLGFDPDDELLKDLNIAMNDLSYFIEVHSYNKKNIENKPRVMIQTVGIRQQNTLEKYLDKKQLQNKKKTLQKLQKVQTNQYGRRKKQNLILQNQKPVVKKRLLHPCAKCGKQEITHMHFDCGHASMCQKCIQNRCYICYWNNQTVIKLLDYMGSSDEQQTND